MISDGNGELFDREAAAERIGHAIEEGFFAEQIADVACETSREQLIAVGGGGQGWSGDGKSIATCGDRADRLQCRADEVLVIVLLIDLRICDDGLDEGVVRTKVLRIERSDRFSPNLTESTDARGLDEQIVAEVQAELDAGGGIIDRVAGIDQALKKLSTGAQGFDRRRKHFRFGGTAPIIDRKEAHQRKTSDEFLYALKIRIGRKTGAETELQRRHILPLRFVHEPAQCSDRSVDQLKIDRGEMNAFHRIGEMAFRSMQFGGIGSAHERVEELIVGVGCIHIDRLGGSPVVLGALVAANERQRTRAIVGVHCLLVADICVDRDAIFDRTAQLFLQRGILQFLRYALLPLLAGCGRKGFEKLFAHRCEDRHAG